MIYGFVGFFVLGLLLAVRAMLHGVERPARRSGGSAPSAKRFVVNLPTTAGFATVFGATGYLLARYARLGPVADVVIAGLAGAAGAVGALALVAAWAIPAAKAEVVDERYVLQGALARLVAVSDQGTSGTITYQAGDGATLTSRALPLDGGQLEVGTDVVIERIEDGVAYVEPWARVEARL
jgi:hypothetical protein